MSRKTQYRCHGDPARFDVVADFIADCFGDRVRYIADVAGGQGLLARRLNKHYNYEAEVIDPRGWVLKGVAARAEEFTPRMALFYDLVVGLHPDEATRAVAEAALNRPTLLVPCCNFWSEEKLGRDELVAAIEDYYRQQGVRWQRATLAITGKNIALLTQPPEQGKPSV